MTDFPRYTLENAPDAAQAKLAALQKSFGFVPSMLKIMAGAPPLLNVYLDAHQALQSSILSKEELTVIWQSINVEHSCLFCVPAHTNIANMMGVDENITNALRNETPLADTKLEALRTFVLSMVRKRGEVSESELSEFFAAGYSHEHVLLVILGIGQKVMSNYTNHVAKTPLDTPFKKFEWAKTSKGA
ncbi:MAG: carboxymuconolactone decarboxylase family protein [Moorea sp. SIO3G5]|nr:carboxymuconolactone decarboxylase family protein [Moorena sp. SIO3G5]